MPVSMASMKVATTVFVGNISDKASDTLVRQMLLVRSYFLPPSLGIVVCTCCWVWCGVCGCLVRGVI